jgi:hypothetical protein
VGFSYDSTPENASMVGVVILVVGGLYLAASAWVAWRITRAIAAGTIRTGAMAVSFIALVLLPISDDVVGYARFRDVCVDESRTEILGELPLPSSLIDRDRRPRPRDALGNIDWVALQPFVLIEYDVSKDYRDVHGLTRHVVRYVRVVDKRDVAKQVNFYYAGGRIRSSGIGIGGSRCIATPPPDIVLQSITAIGS